MSFFKKGTLFMWVISPQMHLLRNINHCAAQEEINIIRIDQVDLSAVALAKAGRSDRVSSLAKISARSSQAQ